MDLGGSIPDLPYLVSEAKNLMRRATGKQNLDLEI